MEGKEDFELFRRYAPPAEYFDCELIARAKEQVGEGGLINTAAYGAFNTLNQHVQEDGLISVDGNGLNRGAVFP